MPEPSKYVFLPFSNLNVSHALGRVSSIKTILWVVADGDDDWNIRIQFELGTRARKNTFLDFPTPPWNGDPSPPSLQAVAEKFASDLTLTVDFSLDISEAGIFTLSGSAGYTAVLRPPAKQFRGWFRYGGH